jgi:hypothetical protein
MPRSLLHWPITHFRGHKIESDELISPILNVKLYCHASLPNHKLELSDGYNRNIEFHIIDYDVAYHFQYPKLPD